MVKGTGTWQALFHQAVVIVFLLVPVAVSHAGLDAPHDASTGTGCLSCHDMASSEYKHLPALGHTSINIDDTVANNLCWGCHLDPVAPPLFVETHSSIMSGNKYGDWAVECWVCHNQHSQSQPGGKFIRSKIDLSEISGVTKTGINNVVFTGFASLADGDTTYNGICEVCHTQTSHFRNDGSGSDQLHTNVGAVAGTDCMKCHKHKDGFVGSGHNDTHFRWSGGCEGCHGAGTAAEVVVSGIHDNKCNLCHITGGPYDADTNKVGDNGDGDATLAEGDAGTWLASCVTCHNQAQVPGFHGITIVEVAPSHNNLGTSRGAWADSGGTIPSTRAAGYSGKIDTVNALLDDDYNCADCHDAEHTGFTPLEALEVHSFELGRGSGNCLTCHGAANVADEISAGKGAGGATIECEDCHSIANGNGPSGKKMYQYDGTRHHQTAHAQTGNCTRCHTDPRPADLSAEPGHAGTAAINDGVIDADGITWDDGFDDDFGLNYSHPGGMPRQMGCRLCHTNYETYTVDVKAEIDSDWDTGEIPDLHGYNKTSNPDYSTSGLTIYANDFDARGTTLTYEDPLGKDEIRGARQTTQVSIPSHRIDGPSKIDVYNYGACFACHTVQIRHAAPKPDPDTNPNNSSEDYDTPIPGYDAASMNTYPYDTLRYSPGRSVFNDFKGSGPPGDAWNNHTKFTGSYPYWLGDWTQRPATVFHPSSGGGTDFFGDINSTSPTSLAVVPINTNTNDLESLPGMTGPTYTIRNFDTGPVTPNIDDITITVAAWTGSAVYVEATSSFGPAQDFSFTYTGPGGPCNTTMTWDTGHYEGTCIAASGWNPVDTVTVSNNTTTAPDTSTRVLTDLTENPVTPVLTNIVLADNNDADPTAAEAGFTNSHSVAVSMSAGNYPTHVMFSEDPGFSPNSGWLLFDPTVNFTLADLGPPPSGEGTRTVYAKVKNEAGESGSQSSTIVLDTVDPAVPADTLTAPNGHINGWQAEFWDVASSQTITWVPGNITDSNLKADPISLKESYDSGATWRVPYIADNEANDGSFAWTVAGSPVTSARIRLDARDKAGNVASDSSDNDYNKSTPYIVTNTFDSGAGSLRQVLQDLINNGGNHSLWFDIPASDPNVVDGVALINLATNLPTINQDNIHIEGGTQEALRGNTNPKGPEIRVRQAGTSTIGFTISGSVFTRIRDLQITGFDTGVSSTTGSDTTLEGNHFGFWSDSNSTYTALANVTNAYLSDNLPVIEHNFFACASDKGLDLTGSQNATVESNIFGLFPDPTDPAIPASPTDRCSTTGTYAIHVGDGADGANIISNIISGSQYGISVGGPDGPPVETTSNTTITGNQFGTFYDTADGWVTAASPLTGLYLNTAGGGNIIGGTNVAAADDTLNDSNVFSPYNPDISFQYRTAIQVRAAADYSTRIFGNFIGTNPECDPVNDRGACEVFPGGRGIYFETTSRVKGVTIGGEVNDNPPCQAGNVIANMSANGTYSYGVQIASPTVYDVELSCNTFYDNGDNTLDDAFRQATPTPSRPVIIAADTTTVRVANIFAGNGTTQQGDMVEVYVADFDGTEYGEGLEFIGYQQAVFGQTYVDVDISAAGLRVGDWVTATRTYHYTGVRYQTSMFSTNVQILGTTSAPSLDWVGVGNYVADGVDPDSAPYTSSFTFQVEYTDTDNEPPVFVEVWVDEDDNGNYDGHEKYPMTEVNPGDTDYTDGKLYERTGVLNIWALVDGILNYRFTAADGSFYTVTGDPTHPLLDDTNTVEVTN